MTRRTKRAPTLLCFGAILAASVVLGACDAVLGEDGETALDEDGREGWRRRADGLAARGLRVLALARKRAADPAEEPYEGLTLLALAGLYDPPREGVPEAVAACVVDNATPDTLNGVDEDTPNELLYAKEP